MNRGLVALPLNVQLSSCQISFEAVPIGRHRNPHLLPVLNSAVKNGDVVGSVDLTLGKKHGLMVALVNISKKVFMSVSVKGRQKDGT